LPAVDLARLSPTCFMESVRKYLACFLHPSLRHNLRLGLPKSILLNPPKKGLMHPRRSDAKGF
jgi:hypothetical protein